MNIPTVWKSLCMVGLSSVSFMTQLYAAEWTLTPQTQVSFDIHSMGFLIVKGRFEQIQSSMHFDTAAPQQASAQFVLDINHLNLSKPSLQNLILGEDFFYLEKYPTATFRSQEFVPLGKGHYAIKGDLTLRGVTQPVVLDTILKPNSTDPQLLDVESKTVVNRSDFGMKKAFAGIGEKVNIEVSGQWQLK
ncbi:YceI family protein [Acinetobacter bouvetii]|uniref:Lipid/polyisoprenoid-binding YceI-like domain-containing protein n=1 Tax=Acinetobacter bouvetii TaxID=202951 RepID=A0A811GB70_9GAMM|nr:YceI family protein [Acinetobacter bouvetii]CAB1211111.1 hypothetical protein SFB21_0901 [Acinetobacter bouvetii]